ncbi:MAG: peptidylprolyl isomerase [Magnetococcales bacterium]|nr:peptidylprolyl isomerase [Magnetococcales bacterium]
MTTAGFLQRLEPLDPSVQRRLKENPEAMESFARDEIVKQYLAEEAHEVKLDQDPAVRHAMDRAAEQALIAAHMARKAEVDPGYPDATLVQETYERNRAQFRVPGRMRVAQIYLEIPSGSDPTARRKLFSDIQAVYQELLKKPARFGELARTRSQHAESAARDGDMGWVEGGALLPVLAPVVESLNPGETSPPVLAGQGWHILRLVERAPDTWRSLDEVREALVAALQKAESQRKVKALLEDLVKRTPPKVHADQVRDLFK